MPLCGQFISQREEFAWEKGNLQVFVDESRLTVVVPYNFRFNMWRN